MAWNFRAGKEITAVRVNHSARISTMPERKRPPSREGYAFEEIGKLQFFQDERLKPRIQNVRSCPEANLATL